MALVIKPEPDENVITIEDEILTLADAQQKLTNIIPEAVRNAHIARTGFKDVTLIAAAIDHICNQYKKEAETEVKLNTVATLERENEELRYKLGHCETNLETNEDKLKKKSDRVKELGAELKELKAVIKKIRAALVRKK